jgi:hypothetical protein
MGSDDGADGALQRAVAALDAASVPYMLTGSFASSFHGTPRTTQDIDIVIAPNLGSLKALLAQFPEDKYYVSVDAALQAYGSEGLFNVVDFASGWKVDFIIRKARAFSVEEFNRRHQVGFLGTTLYIATAEDVVISKMEWAKMSESERQIGDVASILRTRRDELDTAYIERWAATMGLSAQWERARRAAAV